MQGREHPRFAAELEAEIMVDGESLPGRTRNLSGGGLCVVIARGIPLGTIVQLRMALVFDEETFSEALDLEGRVMWSAPTGTDGRHQIGLIYHRVTAEARKYLDLFLKHVTEAEKAED